MSADQEKPRFEPPPWEQEAFERFRKEQEERRAKQELDAALQAALDQQTPQPSSAAGTGTEAPATPATTAQPDAPARTPEPEDPSAIERRAAAMLIELRREEEPVKRVNMAVVNSAMAFMTVMGLYIIVQGLLLAGNITTDTGASTLMAITISLVVFLTGCAFLGGALFLFRKYHR